MTPVVFWSLTHPQLVVWLDGLDLRGGSKELGVDPRWSPFQVVPQPPGKGTTKSGLKGKRENCFEDSELELSFAFLFFGARPSELPGGAFFGAKATHFAGP